MVQIIRASAFLLLQHAAMAFVPVNPRSSLSHTCPRSIAAVYGKGGSSNELGLPCEDECALESFPNLPPSVHPGVLSGQAQVDLYKHAKENGA